MGALTELGVNQQLPIDLLCDNQSAIALTMNPRFHARTKHIEIEHHYIRQTVARGLVRISYCSTAEMTVDILTKALGRIKHYEHSSNMGLRSAGKPLSWSKAPDRRVSGGTKTEDLQASFRADEFLC